MKKFIFTVMVLMIIVLVGSYGVKPIFKGTYQNEGDINGYFIQLSVDAREDTFVLYINNREVNRGTYEEQEDNLYVMKGDFQEFKVNLQKDNSFEIIINKISKEFPIRLVNMGKEATNFPMTFGDEEEYKQLLIDDGKENSLEVDKLLNKCIEYIKNSSFDSWRKINTNIVKILKVEETTMDYVFVEKGREGLLDTSDFIYVIGQTSGHDFANIVCDSETKEVIGYIPIK